jgi:hypothetical protein
MPVIDDVATYHPPPDLEDLGEEFVFMVMVLWMIL